MRRALRLWWTRPSRTPPWLRAGVALVLATVALFGIADPGSSRATTPGPVTAAGGPPSTSPNAPEKSPEPPGPGGRVTGFASTPALRADGQSIYADGCASCHGYRLQGRVDMGPSLYGVGAGPVDFYVSSGRMPLQNPTDEPERAHPAYSRAQTNALIAYITSVGGGPAAPAADPEAGSLALGQSQFTLHCAGCHQIAARGGMTVGAWVPNLQHASARQIAEAVRMGPYLMPHFDTRQIDQHELDSITDYVLYTRHPDDAGGWGIDNIGPIPEGMAAWFIALLAMVIVARLIGERTGREIRMMRFLGLIIALRTAWRTLRGRERLVAHVTDANGAAPDDPSRRDVPADPRAELWVALLLFAAAACALAFVVVYVVAQDNTQLLGLALGIAFLLIAAAVILAGKVVVPQETSVEERGPLAVEARTQAVAGLIHEGGQGVSRRGLMTCAGCMAGGAVVAAVAAPLASLGPASRVLHASPWRRGIRLVDEENRPLTADEIQIGGFYTALPEGESPESFGAGLLVVRLPAAMIHLPSARSGWTPQGIMAFSKICPHAGCAISLFRYPTYAPTSTDVPAFTCPCHYSTFTPGDGGKVIFGPAGRALPQLPIMIDERGALVAAGRFDEDLGPSWWGTSRT